MPLCRSVAALSHSLLSELSCLCHFCLVFSQGYVRVFLYSLYEEIKFVGNYLWLCFIYQTQSYCPLKSNLNPFSATACRSPLFLTFLARQGYVRLQNFSQYYAQSLAFHCSSNLLVLCLLTIQLSSFVNCLSRSFVLVLVLRLLFYLFLDINFIFSRFIYLYKFIRLFM